MANRATLVSFNKEKNVMTCTTCIEFFQSDKISNPFISSCSNLRASAVTDHEQSKTHMKAIVALSAKGKSTTEKMVSEAGKTVELLKSSEVHRLAYLFRNAHVIAKQNRPLTDYKWLCQVDIGNTYQTEHVAREYVVAF
jgi:hypothetical protein